MMQWHTVYAAHFARVESEIMRLGNHVLDDKLYHYLFQRLDNNAMAGTKHAIARGRMALDLSEKGGQGKRKALVSFTANDIDVSLARLERAGLIERVSNDTHLIIKFSAWLEDMRSFDQNEVPKVVPKELVGSYEAKNVNNQYTYATVNNRSREDVTTEVPTNITTTTTTTGVAFRMHLDWKPSEFFYRRIEMSGLKKEQVFQGWVGEFVSYRAAYDATIRTQAQWEHKLLENVLGYIRNPKLGLSTKSNTANSSHKATSVSNSHVAVPNHYDAAQLQNWAVRNGLRPAKSGESLEQYRAALRTLVEQKRLEGERRAL